MRKIFITLLILLTSWGLLAYIYHSQAVTHSLEVEKLLTHINTLEEELKRTQSEYKAIKEEMDKLKKENKELQEFKDKWNVGVFEATAYTLAEGNGDGVTAIGVVPETGRTIAVDPKIIPYGSKVVVDGKEYIAEDTGGDIRGKRLDIFMTSRGKAIEYGRQKVKVIWKD